jgi:hypothetical protein
MPGKPVIETIGLNDPYLILINSRTNSASSPCASVLVSPLCVRAMANWQPIQRAYIEPDQPDAVYFATWQLEMPNYRPYN